MTVADPRVIDLVTAEADGSEYRLVLVENRPFTDSPERCDQLAAKLDAYLDFVDSGGFLDQFPRAAGRPVAFELNCGNRPAGPLAAQVLSMAADRMADRDIRLVINVLPLDLLRGRARLGPATRLPRLTGRSEAPGRPADSTGDERAGDVRAGGGPGDRVDRAGQRRG